MTHLSPFLSPFLFLATLLLGAPLAAQSGNPPPSSSPRPCPDIGVVKTHGISVHPVGIADCDHGMFEFEFGGVKITWEDPICPLFILVEPSWNEIGEKHNTTIVNWLLARTQKFNYECDKKTENCVQVGTDEIGFYIFHVDMPCAGGPPEALAATR